MSDSQIAPSQITKTILGIRNELLAISGITQNPLMDTTLNYKYGIQADIEPADKPKIKYFGVGITGCYNVDDGNLSTPYIPSMNNMDLYTPIPFRCVPIDEDLTDVERAQYRMRVKKTFNEVEYWCYYLKLITFLDTDVTITRTNAETQSEEDYELDINNLNPTPVVASSTGTEGASSEVNVSLNCQLTTTGAEILESVGIIYGDPRRANVSEIGVYTGLDQIVTGEDYEGNALQYTEAIYTQLALHYCSLGQPYVSNATIKNNTLKLGKANTLLL